MTRSMTLKLFLLSSLLAAPVAARTPDEGRSRSADGAARTSVESVLQGWSLHGRAVDEAQRPIVPLVVRLRPAAVEASGAREWRETELGTADPGGRFRVDGVSAAAVDVELRAPGFVTLLLRDLRPAAGKRVKDLGTVVLERSARITGRVTDREGRPLAEVAVHVVRDVRDPQPRLEDRLRRRRSAAISGADGRFVLRGLPASEPFTLFLARPGNASRWLIGVDPRRHREISAVLEPAATVAGSVRDGDGEPVPEVVLRLERRLTLPGTEGRYKLPIDAPPLVAETDADGRFELAEVPVGEALLHVETEAWAPVEPLELVIPADGRHDLEVVLERGAEIVGRTRTEDGEPIAGVRILTGRKSTRSDERGEYRLQGISTGAVEVHARHPDYRPLSEDLEVGEDGNRLDFLFPRGQRVSGRTVTRGHRGIAGATVVLFTVDDPAPRSYRTRSELDGSFRFEPVASGAYRLAAAADGHAAVEREEEVLVEDGPVEDLDLELLPGTTVHGTISGLDRGELARVRVGATGPSDRFRRGRVDADGRYRIADLGPGSWLVEAALDQGRRQTQARLRIEPGTTEARRDLEFADRLSLSGEVRFEGELLAGARISLSGDERAVERTVTTGFDGTFTLANLEAGSYGLSAVHRRHHLIHNQTLQLDDDRWLVLELEAAHVSGTVVDADSGAALAGVWLRLEAALETADARAFVVVGTSAVDGSFLLPRVPAGRYRLSAGKDSHAVVEDRLEVFAGQSVQGLVVELRRNDGLELELLLPAGATPTVRALIADPAGRPYLRDLQPVDAAGRARLTTVPPGEWLVFLKVPGSAVERYTATVPGPALRATLGAAGRLAVSVPGLETSDAIARLEIRGADGTPLIGFDAYGQLTEHWPVIGGAVAVDGVPPGEWNLRLVSAERTWTVKTSTGLGLNRVRLD